MKIIFLTTFILLVFLSVFVNYGPIPLQVKTQSMWQGNSYILEQYFLRSRYSSVVIVGSSLSVMLDFKNNDGCIYNLSLAGDSALTGLRTITLATSKPKKVFVEINVPDRAINDKLIKKSHEGLVGFAPIFYTKNIPMNLFLSLINGAQQANQNRLRKKDLFIPKKEFKENLLVANEESNSHKFNKYIEEEPVNNKLDNGFNSQNQDAIALKEKELSELVPNLILESNLNEFKLLVESLESKGVEIVFFEMPIQSSLEYSPRVKQIRHAFKQAFPNYSFLSFEMLSKGVSVNTRDGVHLTPEAASGVDLNMENYFKQFCYTR